MDRSALDDALEGGGGDSFGAIHIGDKVGQILIDEIDKSLSQFVCIDAAGLQDAQRVGFVKQRQKQMLKRCEFMASFIRLRKRGVNGGF
jgi:hypothetical protein